MGNLEAIELGLRQALLQDGRCLLEQLLQQAEGSLADNTSRPGEKCHKERTKPVHTIFGEVTLLSALLLSCGQPYRASAAG